MRFSAYSFDDRSDARAHRSSSGSSCRRTVPLMGFASRVPSRPSFRKRSGLEQQIDNTLGDVDNSDDEYGEGVAVVVVVVVIKAEYGAGLIRLRPL